MDISVVLANAKSSAKVLFFVQRYTTAAFTAIESAKVVGRNLWNNQTVTIQKPTFGFSIHCTWQF
jgi:hypothetical protein